MKANELRRRLQVPPGPPPEKMADLREEIQDRRARGPVKWFMDRFRGIARKGQITVAHPAKDLPHILDAAERLRAQGDWSVEVMPANTSEEVRIRITPPGTFYRHDLIQMTATNEGRLYRPEDIKAMTERSVKAAVSGAFQDQLGHVPAPPSVLVLDPGMDITITGTPGGKVAVIQVKDAAAWRAIAQHKPGGLSVPAEIAELVEDVQKAAPLRVKPDKDGRIEVPEGFEGEIVVDGMEGGWEYKGEARTFNATNRNEWFPVRIKPSPSVEKERRKTQQAFKDNERKRQQKMQGRLRNRR